jgi:hypothetical protein
MYYTNTTTYNDLQLRIVRVENKDSYHISLGKLPNQIWAVLTPEQLEAVIEQWQYEMSATQREMNQPTGNVRVLR